MTRITAKPSGIFMQHIFEHSKRLEPKAREALRATKSYSIPEARFLTGGFKYSIVISFEGVGAALMRLRINGDIVYEVDTQQQYKGKVELHISDLMVVDFVWDVVHSPKSFSFYTRNLPSSLQSIIGSSSTGGSDYTNFSSNEKDWGEPFYAHALEILGS